MSMFEYEAYLRGLNIIEVGDLVSSLEKGREFGSSGAELPTTLLQRARTMQLALSAESQGHNEARKELAAAREHIREYRRCINIALDEQRNAGMRQDVIVLMTDLEHLLDRMSELSEFSREDEEEEAQRAGHDYQPESHSSSQPARGRC